MNLQEALQRIEAANRDKAPSLNLSNCGLTQIPDEVFTLTHLTELKLGHWSDYTQQNRNRITRVPARIIKLTNLELLDLSCNQLEELPDELSALTNLHTLDISRNRLKQLPQSLQRLTRLRLLDAGYNQLTQMPATFARLTRLQRLNLSHNLLEQLNTDFSELIQLQRLDISNNQLSSLPDAICHLPNLQQLAANGNHLTALPNKIGQLTKLQRLHINNNLLQQLPDSFAQLTALQRCYLSANALQKLPTTINQCESLQLLDLHNNLLSQLPPTITQLRKLEYLDLRDNNLTTLPDALKQLYNLQLLDLRNNKIKKLPEEIAWLPSIQYFYINDNPIESPPPEIAHRGLSAIRHYYTELNKAHEKDYLYEIKLLLVGEGRVGKTTLSRALTLANYQFKDETSTEGIDISEWTIPAQELGIDKDFRINIWDFGGQEIYHATHQFFLTKRSVYILVTESRKEDKHEDFYYWLNIIQLLGDKSPVMLVLNKCDQPTKDLPVKEYQNNFSNLVAFSKISCLPEYQATIQALKTKLKNILANKELLPHLGSPLPKVWLDIRTELEQLKKENKDYISLKEYYAICRKRYIDESGALFLSDFFHDLGIILHFQDDPELKNMIFLNHDWVTTGVYKVLDSQRVKSKRGHFTLDDLEFIWQDEIYANQRRQLLALMKNPKFEICFELKPGYFLAPQLLTVDEPDFTWYANNPLHYEYRYRFMPKGILTRLMVKQHRFIHNAVQWRYGVLLKYEKTEALIREKYFDRKITITISGDNPIEMLELLRNSLEEINGSFNNLQVQEMLACRCTNCLQSAQPHFYPIELLNKYADKGLSEIICEKSLQSINIYLLLQTAFKAFLPVTHDADDLFEQADSTPPPPPEITEPPDKITDEAAPAPKEPATTKQPAAPPPVRPPARRLSRGFVLLVAISALLIFGATALVIVNTQWWWALPAAGVLVLLLFIAYYLLAKPTK